MSFFAMIPRFDELTFLTAKSSCSVACVCYSLIRGCILGDFPSLSIVSGSENLGIPKALNAKTPEYLADMVMPTSIVIQVATPSK